MLTVNKAFSMPTHRATKKAYRNEGKVHSILTNGTVWIYLRHKSLLSWQITSGIHCIKCMWVQ